MNKRILFVFTLAVLSLLTIPRAEPAMVKMSLEQLVRDADLIVVGTVESVTSQMIEGKIFSFATISVNSKIEGEPEEGEKQIVIKFSGGTIGDVAMKVEDSPNYKADEKVVVFLKKIPSASYYKTVGSFQGKFLVQDNAVLKKNLSLDHFLQRIKSIVDSTG